MFWKNASARQGASGKFLKFAVYLTEDPPKMRSFLGIYEKPDASQTVALNLDPLQVDSPI